MHKLLMTLAMAGILNLAYAQEAGVKFEQGLSWKQVVAKAKKERKYIFVDCYATWCGPCKAMDKKTYPDDAVGEVIGKSFIAWKVQCDSTKNDSDTIRNGYSDAHEIVTSYEVNAYPTLLFFSPDGKLVHFGVGYKGPKELVTLAGDALDPKRQYVTILKAYREGRLPYEQMPTLFELASYKDTALSSAILKDYVHNYLDQLPDSAWRDKKNLNALADYARGLNTNSRGIQWLMEHPQAGDSVMEQKGYANRMVDYVAYKEIAQQVIEKSKKDKSTPDWNAMEETARRKVGDKGAKRLVANAKVELYQAWQDWKNCCKAVIEMVDAYGYSSDPVGHSGDLNNFAFDAIFEHSDDKEELMTALKWMEPIVASMTESTPHVADMMDTKAELLYKLGRKDEAIAIETRVVEIEIKNGSKQPRYKPYLEKMRAGQPTW